MAEDSEFVRAVTGGLDRVVETMEKITLAIETRANSLEERDDKALKAVASASRRVSIVGALIAIVGGGLGYLVWRQQDLQDQLAKVALQVEEVDRNVSTVGRDASATKTAVEETQKDLQEQPKIDILPAVVASGSSKSAAPRAVVKIPVRKQPLPFPTVSTGPSAIVVPLDASVKLP